MSGKNIPAAIATLSESAAGAIGIVSFRWQRSTQCGPEAMFFVAKENGHPRRSAHVFQRLGFRVEHGGGQFDAEFAAELDQIER